MNSEHDTQKKSFPVPFTVRARFSEPCPSHPEQRSHHKLMLSGKAGRLEQDGRPLVPREGRSPDGRVSIVHRHRRRAACGDVAFEDGRLDHERAVAAGVGLAVYGAGPLYRTGYINYQEAKKKGAENRHKKYLDKSFSLTCPPPPTPQRFFLCSC